MHLRNISLTSSNLIAKRILFIDGLSRSAKSLLGPIIGSFKNVPDATSKSYR